MGGKYIEVDGQPVETDLMTWANWFETADRTVAVSEPLPGVRVSTVFLGLDHAFGLSKPLLYETMVFGGQLDGWTDRYTTRDEAVDGHAKALGMVDEAHR